MTSTERKYLISIVAGIVAIIGWNAFLIHRDDVMYKAYYRHQALENLKHPPSNVIK